MFDKPQKFKDSAYYSFGLSFCVPLAGLILDWSKGANFPCGERLYVSIGLGVLGILLMWYSYNRVRRRYYYGS
jgi:hypothetical protein